MIDRGMNDAMRRVDARGDKEKTVPSIIEKKNKPASTNAGRIKAIADILKHRYADFDHYNRKNPFEELLFILCSVQTNEAKYLRTFAALRREFPRFADLATANPSAIARPLKPGGLSVSKSRMISRICGLVAQRFGRITLAPLRQMADAECEAFLMALPGAGTKVARCVMLYSLNREVFPVDTHCWRICRRLGWVRKTSKDGVCTKRDMNRLQDMIPAPLRFSLHVNLISFGREICTDKNPNCMACPISDLCRKGKSMPE
jgi:endonuclease-3